MIFLLLLITSAWAWEKEFPQDVPRAIQVIPSTNEIAVGFELKDGQGKVEYYDYAGNRTVRKTAFLEEWPTALRVHSNDLYALTKKHVWIIDLVTGEVTKRAIMNVHCFDFVIDREMNLYCGGSNGFYILEHQHTLWGRLEKGAVDGVALQGDAIYVLRGDSVSRWKGKLENWLRMQKRHGGFRYLVRSSKGNWLSLDTMGISEKTKDNWKRVYSLVVKPVHLAYLSANAPGEDHVLIALPGLRKIVAAPLSTFKK